MEWNKTLPGQNYIIGEKVKVFGRFQIQPHDGKTPRMKFMIPDTKYVRMREKVGRGELSENSALKEFEPSGETFDKPVKQAKDNVQKVEIKEKSTHWFHFCFSNSANTAAGTKGEISPPCPQISFTKDELI